MPGNLPPGFQLEWQNVAQIPVRQYKCAFCGVCVAPNRGWWAKSRYDQNEAAAILVCHLCQRPAFIDENDRQFPGLPYGNPVSGIPEEGLASLYEEARRAAGALCCTAAVLCCRKILMHVAVEKGAKPGESFVRYVDHLASSGYIPPEARVWVDYIRTRANEANHEIAVMSQADAEMLLGFTELLLKVIYEFPAAIRQKTSSAGSP